MDASLLVSQLAPNSFGRYSSASRFRNARTLAAHPLTRTSESKRHEQLYDAGAVFGFEVPRRARGDNHRTFKSTALVGRGTGDAQRPRHAWQPVSSTIAPPRHCSRISSHLS